MSGGCRAEWPADPAVHVLRAAEQSGLQTLQYMYYVLQRESRANTHQSIVDKHRADFLDAEMHFVILD